MIPAVLPIYNRMEIDCDHASGAYIYTKHGERYLDFAAGYAANSLGHCHPHLIAALTKQTSIVWHLSNFYHIPGLAEYSKRLLSLSFADTCFIANSGAEAAECMIKMCRKYFNVQPNNRRYRIITLGGAFHGRTMAACSSNPEKLAGFEPGLPGFDMVPWGDITALEQAISDETAAIMLELIQGEGGMRAASLDYVQHVRFLCDKHGLLLLDDEVQCGMGRTGKLFAYEQYGITPDLMALGKGLGCGFPISACLATEKVGKAMQAGTHGSTFGGNPLAIAVGNAVLDMMTQIDFLPHVNKIAAYLSYQLDELLRTYPEVIKEITGIGLMRGIALHPQHDAYALNKQLFNHKLLLVPAGNNVLRITPPLIIDEVDCDFAIYVLDKVFTNASQI